VLAGLGDAFAFRPVIRLSLARLQTGIERDTRVQSNRVSCEAARWALALTAACVVACGGGTQVIYQVVSDAGASQSGGDGATDAASSAPLDAGTTLGAIHCGNGTCAAGTEECCFTTTTGTTSASCVAAGTCAGTPVACGAPSNCADGQVCCSDTKLAVACKSSCANGTLLCASHDDCPRSYRCVAGLNGYSVCEIVDGG
jgi:hypothetical protein